jgi:hypothetical protein
MKTNVVRDMDMVMDTITDMGTDMNLDMDVDRDIYMDARHEHVIKLCLKKHQSFKLLQIYDAL